MQRTKILPYLKRLLIASLLAAVFVGLINEGAHLLFKDDTDRPPRTVEIEIPPGTAAKVSGGEQVSSLPEEMVFVVGDTLKVRNRDSAAHELGPLYIPPGSSASLRMDDASQYVLGCSFQPSQYLGFDVRSRTTAASRLEAFGLAAPPTAVFFFIYSLLIYPLGGKQEQGRPREEERPRD